MNPESELLRQKRENFRVEIRRKQMEDIFAQKRRKFLSPIEEEITQEKKCLVDSKKCEKFIKLMQQMSPESMQEIQEVLEKIEYELANGRQIDFMEWAGPVDIVKAVIDAMELYQSTDIAVHASRCLNSLTESRNKLVKQQIAENTDKAIDIYKLWFLQQHHELTKDALMGLEKIYSTQDGMRDFQICDDMIDKALLALQAKSTTDIIKRKIYSLFASSAKFIQNDEKLIKVLKVAQTLMEGSTKDLVRGLRIIENASQTESNADFILGMNVFRSIMDLVHHKEKSVGQISMSIIINLSMSNDSHVQEKLIEANILNLVYSTLKDCRRSEFRKNGGLLFSNIMSWNGPVLYQVIEHHMCQQSVLSMEQENLQVRREIYYGWANFFEGCDQSQFLQIANLGVIQIAVRSLLEDDNILLEVSQRILYAVLQKVSGVPALEEPFRQYLFSQNILYLLERLNNRKEVRIYKMAQKIINNFYSEYFM